MSGKRKYPLELILRAHGPAELVNVDEETLWSSDADDDFREEFEGEEFLHEDDIPDVLEYLFDEGILSVNEYDNLDNGKWDVTVETLESSIDEDLDPDDDDVGDEDDDEG